ncbi:uncharacterized protein LOC117569682 [Drosophila albomicans]|uniref:Uncharacterized protein LOC117569682 n=1 Tax=Drosophila albomicans TaxID=7291 RepID=A0A6P8X6D4_DROAB|nr:uncharacterized protein LOC117569682 [Drosophila albomicans]
MMNFNKSLQTFLGLRQVYIAACRFPLRAFSDRDREDEGPSRCHGKQSAVAQLAGSGGSEGKVGDETTPLEAPEAVQLTVNLEHVRSPINELDQRKLRHKEYAQILNELIIKPPSTYTLDQRLPFKQPEPKTDLRQSLRTCTSVEEVLQLTNDPEQLAHELVKLSWELNAEKRKNEAMLENLRQLEQKMRETDQNN